MYRIDEKKIFDTIEEKNPKRVLFNAPDGILPSVQRIAKKVNERYSVDTFILADPCYGSCDTADLEAEMISADFAFHVGHNILMGKMGKKTILVDAFDDISFEETLDLNLDVFRPFKVLGLCTFAQHIHQLSQIRSHLEHNGFLVRVGTGKGQLQDGQVFGCEFYPAFNIKENVDAMVVLGQSRFHALGIALSTQKPTFMVDPYERKIFDMGFEANERMKKAVISLYKALDAKSFGVVVGLKEGQMMVSRSIEIKRELEKRGRKVQLIAMREITNDRLNVLTDLDAFIQTGCPRISIDGYIFSKTVLSAPQAEALFMLIDGKDPGDFLVRGHWL